MRFEDERNQLVGEDILAFIWVHETDQIRNIKALLLLLQEELDYKTFFFEDK